MINAPIAGRGRSFNILCYTRLQICGGDITLFTRSSPSNTVPVTGTVSHRPHSVTDYQLKGGRGAKCNSTLLGNILKVHLDQLEVNAHFFVNK